MPKVVGKLYNVGAALTQQRNVQRKLVDAVVEVLTKQPFGNGLWQIFVGGAHQSDVDGALFVAAHSTYAPFLQGAQQLYLYVVAEITYFVEKERTARSLLKRPHLVGRGTGKGTFLCPKVRRQPVPW